MKLSNPYIQRFSISQLFNYLSKLVFFCVIDLLKQKMKVVKAGNANNRNTGAKVVSTVPAIQSKSIKKLIRQAPPLNVKMQKPQQSKITIQQVNPAVSVKQNHQSSIAVAVQTANSIASNNSHPNQSQVSELLGTLEKGWIDEKKFIDILKTLMF